MTSKGGGGGVDLILLSNLPHILRQTGLSGV